MFTHSALMVQIWFCMRIWYNLAGQSFWAPRALIFDLSEYMGVLEVGRSN
jgi:hypothetical protein